MEFRTHCNGSTCQTEILMSDVPTGKPHPWDWPLPTCKACKGVGYTERQAVKSMFDGGGLGVTRDQCKKCKGRGKVYVSHYTTCPNADEFRWKQKGA